MNPDQPLRQSWFDELQVTVIGNIYENPELIEV